MNKIENNLFDKFIELKRPNSVKKKGVRYVIEVDLHNNFKEACHKAGITQIGAMNNFMRMFIAMQKEQEANNEKQ